MIYDCFTFYDEFDLLEIRLKVLNPYVDRFVIVELAKTHRGVDKPLYFKNHREKFSEYSDKIIYVCPDDVPEYKGPADWTIENYQRNSIMLGLKDCKPDDIIMISDVDEIPNPIIFERYNVEKYPAGIERIIIKRELKKRNFKFFFSNTKDWRKLIEHIPVAVQMDFCYYYLNYCHPDKWNGTVIVKYKNLDSPQKIREYRDRTSRIPDAGWHFSYMGGVEFIKRKLKTIIDGNPVLMSEMNRCADDDEWIEKCINEGLDLYGRGESKFQVVKWEDFNLPYKDEFRKRFPHLFR